MHAGARENGSCFAQHIGRRLRDADYHYVDAEPAPTDLPRQLHAEHGYGLYSARYGNVYTTTQLRQLIERALGEFEPKEAVWRKGDGYVDAFCPTIQPEPFASEDECIAGQRAHLASVRRMFEEAELFVFTLGLTEAWQSKLDGAVYPVAPGVSGGRFDDSKYQFVNIGFRDALADMREVMSKARSLNRKMRFLLTVSPVPLMATASGKNVVVATTYSKSVLRAVAGQLADMRGDVDYFPSYEIISSHIMGGRFYEADGRSVASAGVDHVMAQFFAEHWRAGETLSATGATGASARAAGPSTSATAPPLSASPPAMHPSHEDEDDVICDEELLAAFGPTPYAAGKGNGGGS